MGEMNKYTAVIFGGTAEGRLLAERFAGKGINIHLSVVTEYGATLLPKADNIHVHCGRLDEKGIESFLRDVSVPCDTGMEICIDATHPYAVEVTKNIRTACESIGVEYLRVRRRTDGDFCGIGDSETEASGKAVIESAASCGEIIFVDSVQAAAEYLAGTEGKILITTGSKELSKYTVIPDYKDRCFARVLPTLPVMESCKALGFEGRNLIGMQGPFSEELNLAMIRQCDVRYMVTKQSGANGGYNEKCEAAMRAGINLVVVGAPDEEDTCSVSLEEAVRRLDKIVKNSEVDMCSAMSCLKSEIPDVDMKKLSEHYMLQNSLSKYDHVVYLVGMGPGSPKLCTVEAVECLNRADVLIGAGRILEICDRISDKIASKPHFVSYKAEEISDFLTKHQEYKNIAVVFSGDIGFYSGAESVAQCLQGRYKLSRIPGLSSPIYLLDRLGISWSEVDLASRHGQKCDVVSILREKKRVCLLLGKATDVPDICGELISAGFDTSVLIVGERLSYEDERIVRGTAESLKGQEFDPLSVVYISII